MWSYTSSTPNRADLDAAIAQRQLVERVRNDVTENRRPCKEIDAFKRVLDTISKIIDDGDVYDPGLFVLKFCEGHCFLEIWQFATSHLPCDPWKSHARL